MAPPIDRGGLTPKRLDDHARLDARVRGRVQGVGFRWFVVREGMDLQLDGWVANDADGSVHCVAEGPRSDLERLLAAIEVGPPAALVDRVNTMWGPAIGGLGPFGIRSGVHSGD